MINKILNNSLKTFIVLALILSSSLADVKTQRIDKVLNNTMTISMEKFLSLTNYLERHNYIYRHDAREILAVFNTVDRVDIDRLNEFGTTIDSLREEINRNPRVKIDVKERVETQVNEILAMIQLALSKRDSIFNVDRINQQIAVAERKLADAKKVRESSAKVIVKKEKASATLPIGLGALLIISFAIFVYDRRRLGVKIKRMKKQLSLSFKKIKSVEKGNTLSSSFVKVVEALDCPISVVVDLKGNILSSSKSFERMFSSYFNLKSDNWDTFFENNFYLSKNNDNKPGNYKFRKNGFLNISVTSQLIASEEIRFLTFSLIDSEELMAIKSSDLSRLNNGVSSANEVFENALTKFSKVHQLNNIVIDQKSFEGEIATYSHVENLQEMFYRMLQFAQVFDSEMNNERRINMKLERVESVLKLSAVVENTEFNLDSNSRIKDGIRELSKFVSEADGEFRVYKESIREKTNVVFELNVYDSEVAFENRITTVVENESLN
ncbi:hypothetical protein [Halobacteriovorax sp. JY17]|uniref:hypothetical protein n=1 Tax=Halobacteriovorax sp. JY17 TaxID=2014617 RepID=UPI0025C3B21F|nr:hypothetical protein [Halobacteriovorax sp. JY17]